MDRRTLIALALSFVVILVYTRFIAPPPPRRMPQPSPQQAAVTPTPPQSGREKAEADGPREAAIIEPKGKLSTVRTEAMEIAFSTEGGAITHATLFKSPVIKKGPIHVVQPLDVSPQSVTLKIQGLDDAAEYLLESENAQEKEISFLKAFDGLTIQKTYRVQNKGYVINARIMIKNTGAENVEIRESVELAAGAVVALTVPEKDTYVGIERLDETGKVARIGAGKTVKGWSELRPTRWFALRNQFFTVIVKPGAPAMGSYARAVRLEGGLSGIEGGLMLGPLSLAPGATKEFAFDIYMGPKEYTALAAFGAPEMLDFGWFGFIGKWILLGLNALYRLCGNYGVAIILLTIVIRIILFPLNQKSFRSMKNMQALQPEITALQQKYKGDPKKSQAEMMKLYKEHKVNPMGGRLPLLIQMPILIAFFRVLQNAIELWGAPFFLWMTDLSEPDALMRFSTGKSVVPFIGRMVDGHGYIFLNVLPILMLLVFYIQQKMTPSGMSASPEQQQQQKMMGVLMPLMFGVIFYNMPAGLNLYFAASTLLGIIQQKYMIK